VTDHPLFHLAIHVTDLDEAVAFYVTTLGCRQGRRAESWVDIDFFGHQLSLHLGTPFATADTGHVDATQVPMPHFGAILPAALWHDVAARLRAAGIEFVLAPHTRFPGQPGEQLTMFLRDPSGNPIELKGAETPSALLRG
jgi:extradiol dioxygenase family protein